MRQALAAAMLVFMAGTARAVIVQNWVQNAHFDASLAGWTLLSNAPGGSVTWQAADGIGASRSGSMRIATPGQSSAFGIEAIQCLALTPTPGTEYAFSARLRHLRVPASSIVAHAAFYPGAGCAGGGLSDLFLVTSSSANDVWTTEQKTGVAPTGAHSVAIELSFISVQHVATHLDFDDLYFGPAAPSSCTTGSGVLCVNDAPGDARFRIFGNYSTSQGGGSAGGMHAIDLSSLGVAHGGLMWFFAADNPELLVKVLNGCAITNHYWAFLSAGTNVGLDLYGEDTQTGGVTTYHNPDVSPFPAVQDLYALPCD